MSPVFPISAQGSVENRDRLQRLSIVGDSCLETLLGQPWLLFMGWLHVLTQKDLHFPNLFLKPNQIKGQLQPQTSPRIFISLFTFTKDRNHTQMRIEYYFLIPKWKWSIYKSIGLKNSFKGWGYSFVSTIISLHSNDTSLSLTKPEWSGILSVASL